LIRELETHQDVSIRPIVENVQNLEEQDLKDLSELTAFRGSLEQIMFYNALYDGSESRTKQQLQESLDRFVDCGVLSVIDGVIIFKGDDFDRIYCKYYARNRGIPLRVSPRPFDRALESRLSALFYLRGISVLGFPEGNVVNHEDFGFVQTSFRSNDQDPFQKSENAAISFFHTLIQFRERRRLPVIFITLAYRSTEISTVIIWIGPKSLETFPVRSLKSELSQMSSRIEHSGGSMSFDIRYYGSLSLRRLMSKIAGTSRLRKNGV